MSHKNNNGSNANGSKKNNNGSNNANTLTATQVYNNIRVVSAWVLQAHDADASAAARVDVQATRAAMADKATRQQVRAMAEKDNLTWARVYGAWRAACTQCARTSIVNKGVALVHANALAVDAETAHKRLCAYINYNYKKGVWDAPVSPSAVKTAAQSVNIIYNQKGLNLDAMLRAAIKAAQAQ